VSAAAVVTVMMSAEVQAVAMAELKQPVLIIRVAIRV
jgi:hypothetical protein